MAVAVLVAVPISASAGEPYFASDDAAAYQSAQYGQPIPPPPPYPGSSGSYARHKQLVSQLNYAEWHYNHARQAGNWEAANHWKKQIKHPQRGLSLEGRAEGPGYGTPAYMTPLQPSNGPASAYAPPMQEYEPPNLASAQPYPATPPPYGYATPPPNGYTGAPSTPYYPAAGYPPAAYPPAGYPNTSGYPNLAGASPYGAPVAGGSAGGLSSLLGPLFGAGSAPSGMAGYPSAAAGSTNGAPASAGSMGDIVNSLMGSMRGSGSIP